MSDRQEILVTLHCMAMRGELSTVHGVIRSQFDGSIQYTMSEYDKAVDYVKKGIIPAWLILQINKFRGKLIV